MSTKYTNQQKQNMPSSTEIDKETSARKNVGGAPKKDKARKSTERYSFYCTPAESEKLRATAEKYDMKIAEFIKFKVFDKYRNS